MKIALVTRRYPPLIGGAEKVLSYLAPALAEAGAEVTVLTSRPPGLAGKASEEVPTSSGRLVVTRLATSRARFVGTWLYMRNLRRWFARNPIDLAYVSMLKHDAYVAVGAGRRLGFPVVLRPEGAGMTGDLAWQGWGRFGRTIGRRCKQANAIISISEAITTELVAAGYEPSRIQALPNGVPVPAEPWRPRPGWQAAPHAVWVGRLAPEKGLHTVIAAWLTIRSHYPEARLTLVGEGPIRPSLIELIEHLGLVGSVELAGPRDDPSGMLRAADLFVLPSSEEGMSVALLEAMALGMPLVASAIPGNRQLVNDLVHGRLAPPGDSDAFATTILAQWSNFDRAVPMGCAARERVIRDYSIEIVARRHLELFRKLRNGAQRASSREA